MGRFFDSIGDFFSGLPDSVYIVLLALVAITVIGFFMSGAQKRGALVSRLIAYWIDNAVFAAIFPFIATFTLGLAVPLSFLIYPAYFGLLQSVVGFTVGGLVTGTRTVRYDTGGKITFIQSCIRVVLAGTQIFAIVAVFNNEGRTLYDLLTNTKVIRKNNTSGEMNYNQAEKLVLNTAKATSEKVIEKIKE